MHLRFTSPAPQPAPQARAAIDTATQANANSAPAALTPETPAEIERPHRSKKHLSVNKMLQAALRIPRSRYVGPSGMERLSPESCTFAMHFSPAVLPRKTLHKLHHQQRLWSATTTHIWRRAALSVCTLPDQKHLSVQLLRALLSPPPAAQVLLAQTAAALLHDVDGTAHRLHNIELLWGLQQSLSPEAFHANIAALKLIKSSFYRLQLLQHVSDMPKKHVHLFWRMAEELLVTPPLGKAANALAIANASRTADMEALCKSAAYLAAPRQAPQIEVATLSAAARADLDNQAIAEAMFGCDIVANADTDRPANRHGYNSSNENVMASERQKMVKHAWSVLLQQTNERLPPSAIEPLMSRALRRLETQEYPAYTSLTSVRKIGRPPHQRNRPPRLNDALNVWFTTDNDPWEQNRTSGVITNYPVDAALGHQKKFGSLDLATFIWQLIHQPNGAGIGNDTPLARLNMRVSFWINIAEQRDPKFGRLCAVGFTQRMLTVLQNYYPIYIDSILPEQLLTALSEQYFGGASAEEVPSAATVESFLSDAVAQAQQLYGQTAHLPQPASTSQPRAYSPQLGMPTAQAQPTDAAGQDNYTRFLQLLQDYIAYEFDYLSLPTLA